MLSRPLELIVGLSVFATVAAGGLVRHVASTSLVVLLVISFFYVRSWPGTWRQLTSTERWVLLGFGLYVLSAIFSYYNVSDEHEYIKHLGKYARFIVIVPVYLLLSKLNLKLFPYLLAGAIIAGPLYFGAALLSVAEYPSSPAQGYYHHITFGGTAVLNGLFLTVVLVMMKISRVMKMVLAISILCLLYSSILSQSRGAWMALPICLPLLLFVAVRYKKIKIGAMLIVSVVLAVVIVLSPAADIVSSRWQKAVHEITDYQNGEGYWTSVGVRLAMWDAAIGVWQERPIVGTGLGDFDLEMQSGRVLEKYKNMPAFSSAHNIFFQSLATTGTIGFVTLCLALFVFPFRLFYMSRDKEGLLNVASLSGMVVLMAFAAIGLTESWTLRAPMVSVFSVYIVTLMFTASSEADV